jgi:hypothetical protein
MSFLRHMGIFRSDDCYAAGSERLSHSQRSSDSMSSSRLFLGSLLSSSARPPLHRPGTILNNRCPPYDDFSSNGDIPLNLLSQHKGALHSAVRSRDSKFRPGVDAP